MFKGLRNSVTVGLYCCLLEIKCLYFPFFDMPLLSHFRLPQLMDVLRSNFEAMIERAQGGPNFMMHSGISQASEYDDPPGLREKAEYLLREWVNLYHSAAAGRDSTKAFSAFVGQVRCNIWCDFTALSPKKEIVSLCPSHWSDAPAGNPKD